MPGRGRRPLGSPDARRAVLDAARELFAERGFERTTMRAVAGQAGVDPALIYHYFGDKDGLLFAALQPPEDAAALFAGLARHGPHRGALEPAFREQFPGRVQDGPAGVRAAQRAPTPDRH